jgi:hypothetical protein
MRSHEIAFPISNFAMFSSEAGMDWVEGRGGELSLGRIAIGWVEASQVEGWIVCYVAPRSCRRKQSTEEDWAQDRYHEYQRPEEPHPERLGAAPQAPCAQQGKHLGNRKNREQADGAEPHDELIGYAWHALKSLL